MAGRKDPWEDFEPVHRDRPKETGALGFVLILIVIVCGGAAIGAVAGALWNPGVTRSERFDNLQEDTPEQMATRAVIGAIIGGVLAGGSFIGMKFKSMKEK